MRILFIFVDGIGIGEDDASINPFVVADTPTLLELSNGQRWVKGVGRQVTERGVFIPTDPRLGVDGRPQSGTSQASILTGKNIPSIIGRHYGPKPEEKTREIIREGTFFSEVKASDKKSALMDGYPDRLLKSIARGKTLPSSIQMSAIESGQNLFTAEDIIAERAITAEWTGEEWHSHLKITEVPLYTAYEAGQKLVEISREYDFAFHSHWMTDYIGHRGTVEQGVSLLERLDGVMKGIMDAWGDDEGLVIMTSDHGNMEHIGIRQHTSNDVPTIVWGNNSHEFAEGLAQLTDFVPRMRAYLDL